MKKKHCASTHNLEYAGTHLLVELWNGENFSSLVKAREILRDCFKACRVGLSKISLHKFSPSDKISAAALAYESHMVIHTWPQQRYAAMDIFVRNKVNPYAAVKILKKGFRPKTMQVVEIKRGVR